jgi:protease-4
MFFFTKIYSKIKEFFRAIFSSKIWKRLFIPSLIILSIIITMLVIGIFFPNYSSIEDDVANDCNIRKIDIAGDISSYATESEGGYIAVSSDNIIKTLEDVEKDNSISGILLAIDSYGGAPVASEEIARAILESKKPTVAWIRDAGTSGAYLIATGTKRIFAAKSSDIGSIGVILSYTDVTNKNKRDGVTYNQIVAGKFKDTGSENKKLTAEEKALLQRDVDITYENFIKMVAENRKMDIAKVRELADGSTMMGEMALEKGLIDEIGGLPEVKKYLSEQIGEEAVICWLNGD